MEKVTEEKKVLQWYPAFYAGLQIELADEAHHLQFESEHQLGTKPKQIDVLIIKKDSNVSIKKNIGRIFKGHNIIEYKSPEDYLSIDDFYKVYGYACFYKSDTAKVDEIKAKDITISYVSKKYPYKVIRHLERELKLKVHTVEKGIYYVQGMNFPIQLIVTSRLTEEENLWLHSLTDDLKSTKQAERLLRDYEVHKNENLYQSMMNIIIDANEQTFKEERDMCEAIYRIARERMQDEFEAREEKAKELGVQEGVQQGLNQKLVELVTKKLSKGKSVEEIADALEENVETIEKIIKEIRS